MCTREEVKLELSIVEKRLNEKIESLRTEFEEQLTSSHNEISRQIHVMSPETKNEIDGIKSYINEHKESNKKIVWWLIGSIGTFSLMAGNTIWWGATITAELKHNTEQIQKLSSDSLVKQDASVLQAQYDSMKQLLQMHIKDGK